jgi:hypothetical protein
LIEKLPKGGFFDAGDVYTKDQSIDLGPYGKCGGDLVGIPWARRLNGAETLIPDRGKRHNWEFSIGLF